jgi:hypothetical protein
VREHIIATQILKLEQRQALVRVQRRAGVSNIAPSMAPRATFAARASAAHR